MSLSEYISRKPPLFFWTAGTATVLLLGVPDYLLGHGFGFSIFYLIPILISTWYSGKGTGIYIAVISSAVWFISDHLAGNPFILPYVPIWNAFIRLVFFLLVVFLLIAFKREKSLAREDYLTGLGNRRHFFELADNEIKRSLRYGHPLSVAYIDIDKFKLINDRFGHDEGDALLKSVAEIIKENIRSTDIDARLGGDEFGLLLPESNSESAVKFFNKLHGLLSQITAHKTEPVTFSIGVVTFLTTPPSVDEMIKKVDELMYAAKERGKNRVTFAVVGNHAEEI